MNHKRNIRKHRGGFSLIELLVVIAIIAAIMGILLPGLGKAKGLARRTRCAANLKQIDAAMHSYINTNDDTYPSADPNDPLSKKQPTDPNIWLWMGRGFRKFLSPHLGGNIDANNPSVLLCLSDRTEPQKYESTSYAYSMAFYHSPEQIDTLTYTERHPEQWYTPVPSMPQKITCVAKPSGKIIIGEWFSNHFPVVKDDKWYRQGWWSWDGKRNYLFADGQVRFLDANEIRPAHDGNPNPNVTIHGIRGIDWPK